MPWVVITCDTTAVVRVLLLDEGWNSTVLIARALELAGHAVTVLTPNGSTRTYRRRSVTWASGPRLDSTALMPALDERVRSLRVDRVLPLTERWMERLWRTLPAWHERIFPATTVAQRELLASKQRVLAAMASRGIDVPRHVAIAHAASLGVPVVLKGDGGAGGSHVRIVDRHEDVPRAITGVDAGWVAQEYIAGPTFLVGALCAGGEALRIYAGEKLEQYPPRTGPAIRLRSQRLDALIELGTRVFRELRWTGLISADVMQRPNGSFVLIEVNPRPWGSIAAAGEAGVDMLGGFADLVAGRVPAPDLAFAASTESRIFPRYLMDARYQSIGGIVHVVRDLLGERASEWRDPAFVLRNLRRVYSLRDQWKSHLLDA